MSDEKITEEELIEYIESVIFSNDLTENKEDLMAVFASYDLVNKFNELGGWDGFCEWLNEELWLD